MIDQIITAEQIEKATEARLVERGYISRHSIPKCEFEREQGETRAAFRAAGFRIEGDET